MGKTYEGIWRLIPKASYIKSSGNLSTKVKGRSSTSLTHGGNKGNTGKQYTNSIRRG